MDCEQLSNIAGSCVSSAQPKERRSLDNVSRNYSTVLPIQPQARRTPTSFKKVSLDNSFPSANEENIAIQTVSSPFPSGAPNAIRNYENDINTTLVGSNNISLNKKIVFKRDAPFKQGHGLAASLTTGSVALSQNGNARKEQFLSTKINISNSQSLGPITNLNTDHTLSAVASQSILHPITVSNSSNQIIQFIQTPQLVATPPNESLINQQEQAQSFPLISSLDKGQNQLTHLYGSKVLRGPPQILPKPPSPALQASTEKVVITESKTFHLQQTEKILHPSQLSTLHSPSGDASSQGGSIILPTGNLNNQPLFLNQPVVVQQAVPQGVQIVLKHPTSAMTGASILIQHPRFPLQQSVPQQVLRIVNSNTTMHISTPPTIVLSTHQNLMQSNLSGINENSQSTPITHIDTLHADSKTQSMAASMNNHVLGQSVTQLQNLQVSGNIAHIPISNGLNGSFIPPTQSQFQHTFPDFNQFCQNINLGQLNTGSLQQIPNITTGTLQSSCQQFNAEIKIRSTGTEENLHLPTSNIQNMTSTLQPSSESLYSMTPITTDMKNVVIYCKGGLPVSQISSYEAPFVNEIKIKPKRIIRKKKKKKSVISFTKIESAESNLVKNDNNWKLPESIGQNVKGTGKLDLANVMKLCGILEEDEFVDTDVEQPLQNQAQALTITKLKSHIGSLASSQTVSKAVSGNIAVNVSNSSPDKPLPQPTPPTQNEANKRRTILQNSNYALKQNAFDLKTNYFLNSKIVKQIDQANLENPPEFAIKKLEGQDSTDTVNLPGEKKVTDRSLLRLKNDTISSLLRSQTSIPAMSGTPSAADVRSITVDESWLQNKYLEAKKSQILISTSPIEITDGALHSKDKNYPFISLEKSKTTSTGRIHAKNLESLTSSSICSQDVTSNCNVPKPLVQNAPISINFTNTKLRHHDSAIDGETSRHNRNVNKIRSTPSTVQTFQSDSINFIEGGQQTSNNMQRAKNFSTIITNNYDKKFLKQNLSSASKNFPDQSSVPNGKMSSKMNDDIVEKFRVHEIPRKKNTLQVSVHHNHEISFSERSPSEEMIEKGNRLPIERDLKIAEDDHSKLIFQTFLNGALFNVTLLGNSQENTSKNPFPGSNNLSDDSKTNNFFQSHSKIILPKPRTKTLLQNSLIDNDTEFSTMALNSQQSVDQVSKNLNKSNQMEPEKVTLLPSSLTLLQGNDIITLPKIMSDSQIFSLNTATNQIKHICASQTTTVLKPMEQLLIAPAGIDAQQINQCWSQGQIHFENVDDVTRTYPISETTNKSVFLWKPDHQTVHPTSKHVVHPFHHTQPMKKVANVAPMIDVTKTKRNSKLKKSKTLNQKNSSENANISPQSQSFSVRMAYKNPIQIVQPNITKEPQRSIKALPTFTTVQVGSPSTNIHQHQPQLGTKLVAVTAPIQKNLTNNLHDLETVSNHKNINDAAITQNLQLQSYPGAKIDLSSSSMAQKDTLVMKKLNGAISHLRLASSIDRVERSQSKTIGKHNQNETFLAKGLETNNLSQQQQQILKNLELQIQQFSEKLQNKKLSSLSIPVDFDTKLLRCNARIPSAILSETATNNETCTDLQSLLAEQQKMSASDKEYVVSSTLMSRADNSLSTTDKEDQSVRSMPLRIVESVGNEITNHKNLSTSTGTCLDLECDISSKLKSSYQNAGSDDNTTARQELLLPIRMKSLEQFDNKQPVAQMCMKTGNQPSDSYDLAEPHIEEAVIEISCKNIDKSPITANKKNVIESINENCDRKQKSATTNDVVEQHTKKNNCQEVVKVHQVMNQNFGEQIEGNDGGLVRGFVECRQDQSIRQGNTHHEQKSTEDQDQYLENLLKKQHQKESRIEQQNEIYYKQLIHHCQPKCNKKRADLDEQNLNVKGNSQIMQRQLARSSQDTNAVKLTHQPAIIRKRRPETPHQKQNIKSTEKEIKNTFLNPSEKQYKISPKRKLSIHKLLPQEKCKISALLHLQQRHNQPIKQKVDKQIKENEVTTSRFVQENEQFPIKTDKKELPQSDNSENKKKEVHQPLDLQSMEQPTSNMCSDKSPIFNSSDQHSVTSNRTEKTQFKLLSCSPPILADEQVIVSAQIEPESSIKRSNIPLRFLFERQLGVDQQDCVNPDYITPFHSKEEAIKRLIRFHCMYQECEEKLSDARDELEDTAIKLQRKFQILTENFQQLMVHESMRTHDTSEICLINRLLVSDIQGEINDIRGNVSFGDKSTVNSQVKAGSSRCFSSTLIKEECADLEVHSMCLQQLCGQDGLHLKHNSSGTVQMSLQLYRYEDQNTLRFAKSSISQQNLRDIFDSNHDCPHKESNFHRISGETSTACNKGGLSPIKTLSNFQIINNHDSKSPSDLYNISSDHVDRAFNKRKIIFSQRKEYNLNPSNNKLEVMGETHNDFFTGNKKKQQIGSSWDHFKKCDTVNSCNCVLKTYSKNISPWQSTHDYTLGICKSSNQNSDCKIIFLESPRPGNDTTDGFELKLTQKIDEDSTAKNQHFDELLSSEKGIYIKNQKNTHVDVCLEAVQEVKSLLNLKSSGKTHLEILDSQYSENSFPQLLDSTKQNHRKEKSNEQLDLSESLEDNLVLNNIFESKHEVVRKRAGTLGQTFSCDACKSSESTLLFPLSAKSTIRNNSDVNIKINATSKALKRSNKQYLFRAEKRHKNDSNEAKQNISAPPETIVSAIACSVELLEPQLHTTTSKSSCKTKKRDLEVTISSMEYVPEKKPCISEKYSTLEDNYDNSDHAKWKRVNCNSKITDEVTQTAPKTKDSNFLRHHHFYSGSAIDCCLRVQNKSNKTSDNFRIFSPQNKSIQTSDSFCILSPLHDVPTSSLLCDTKNTIPANLKHDHNMLNEKNEPAGFSNFDEDINRHVQHAIDTILHLQNCENNNSMDSCVGPNVMDNSLRKSHTNVEDAMSVKNNWNSK